MKKKKKKQTPKPQPQPVCHTVNTGTVDWKGSGQAQFAVNALVIANQSSWSEEFCALLEQVHRLHLMPNDMKCVRALFEARGFIHQSTVREQITVGNVIDYMNQHCHEGQLALVKAAGKMPVMAIVPGSESKYVPKGSTGYHCCGILSSPGYYVSDIWVRWADGQDHSPVKRRKGRGGRERTREIPADHESFHYLQKNPAHSTKDCVVRAIAAVLDISWDEAMDRLAAASGNENTTINDTQVFQRLLTQEGFIRREPLRVGRRLLTGKELCRELDKMMLHGERVFVQAGSSHVAAVLPLEENGTSRYKIVDSWDSTSRPILEYWVREAPDSAAHRVEKDVVSVGTIIHHPLFGHGVVRTVDPSGWVEVALTRGGSRIFGLKWLLRNCDVEVPE